MYKLRTLAPGAEHRLGNVLGDDLTALHEEEATSIGRVLRAVHVDELPQLWNVVRGDMSMVGPRPIRPAFFERADATRSRSTGSGSSCGRASPDSRRHASGGRRLGPTSLRTTWNTSRTAR